MQLSRRAALAGTAAVALSPLAGRAAQAAQALSGQQAPAYYRFEGG